MVLFIAVQSRSNFYIWMKHQCVNIEMKAIKKYFYVVLFIMLYKVLLTVKYVDEILVCDHSNERYQAVLSCGTVYYIIICCTMWFLTSKRSRWLKLVRILNPSEFHSIVHFIQAYAMLMNAY